MEGVRHLIKDDTLDKYTLHILESFIKARGQLYVGLSTGEYLKNQSIFKALCDLNFLYAEKHVSYLTISSLLDLKFVN